MIRHLETIAIGIFAIFTGLGGGTLLGLWFIFMFGGQ